MAPGQESSGRSSGSLSEQSWGGHQAWGGHRPSCTDLARLPSMPSGHIKGSLTSHTGTVKKLLLTRCPPRAEDPRTITDGDWRMGPSGGIAGNTLYPARPTHRERADDAARTLQATEQRYGTKTATRHGDAHTTTMRVAAIRASERMHTTRPSVGVHAEDGLG